LVRVLITSQISTISKIAGAMMLMIQKFA